MANSMLPAKQNLSVSRRQLEMLVTRAGQEAVEAALIQNGSAPEAFTVSRRQMQVLLEKAGPEAVSAALIQNGSAPTAFTTGKK